MFDFSTPADPIELFEEWFAHAGANGIPMPEAVALATSTPDGHPSVRMVLLKEVDARGFVFFTNYTSRKAKEVDANPHAALCFHWTELERQVRVTGTVHRVGPTESDAYFQSRPRGSRIGAWASRQSTPLSDRGVLEAKVAEVEKRFGEGHIPLPPFWGGYRIEPATIEFWQGRTDRLHDRCVYHRGEGGWRIERLYP